MRSRTLLRCIAPVLLAGCTQAARLPAPPSGVTTVAVATVENKTGSALVVSGDGFVARWLGRKRVSVADMLRDELRKSLRDRGFTVADGGSVPTLRVTLRRFEPDLPQLAWIEVALGATLAAPDGTAQWEVDRSRWLVPVRGAPTIAAAYESATRDIAHALVDGWQPGP